METAKKTRPDKQKHNTYTTHKHPLTESDSETIVIISASAAGRLQIDGRGKPVPPVSQWRARQYQDKKD